MVSNMTRPYKQDLNGHVYYIYIAYIYTIFHICLMCPTYIHTYIYSIHIVQLISVRASRCRMGQPERGSQLHSSRWYHPATRSGGGTSWLCHGGTCLVYDISTPVIFIQCVYAIYMVYIYRYIDAHCIYIYIYLYIIYILCIHYIKCRSTEKLQIQWSKRVFG